MSDVVRLRITFQPRKFDTPHYFLRRVVISGNLLIPLTMGRQSGAYPLVDIIQYFPSSHPIYMAIAAGLGDAPSNFYPPPSIRDPISAPRGYRLNVGILAAPHLRAAPLQSGWAGHLFSVSVKSPHLSNTFVCVQGIRISNYGSFLSLGHI